MILRIGGSEPPGVRYCERRNSPSQRIATRLRILSAGAGLRWASIAGGSLAGVVMAAVLVMRSGDGPDAVGPEELPANAFGTATATAAVTPFTPAEAEERAIAHAARIMDVQVTKSDGQPVQASDIRLESARLLPCVISIPTNADGCTLELAQPTDVWVASASDPARHASCRRGAHADDHSVRGRTREMLIGGKNGSLNSPFYEPVQKLGGTRVTIGEVTFWSAITGSPSPASAAPSPRRDRICLLTTTSLMPGPAGGSCLQNTEFVGDTTGRAIHLASWQSIGVDPWDMKVDFVAGLVRSEVASVRAVASDGSFATFVPGEPIEVNGEPWRVFGAGFDGDRQVVRLEALDAAGAVIAETREVSLP